MALDFIQPAGGAVQSPFLCPAQPIGIWKATGSTTGEFSDRGASALRRIRLPVFAVAGTDGGTLLRNDGAARLFGTGGGADAVDAAERMRADGASGEFPLLGYLPPLPLEHLGDPQFCRTHGTRYAYVTGAMANGIGSVEIVLSMSRVGGLGFFGSAGLALYQIENAIARVQAELGAGEPYGFNLIHSPQQPAHELATVELYLRRGVRLVEASAFLGLTMPVVKYRVSGIHRDAEGNVVAPNRVIAKVSRVEVATKFMTPPPEKILRELVAAGELTEAQARLAALIPLAGDVTAEADSGGHTDNRPALTMLPSFLALRDRLQEQFRYPEKIRVGLGGGISTPDAAAAAFALGAAYILTGSVNQACIEAGTSDKVREMLAAAEQADVAMAPAADMFEMGVNVQVLKRGTMFSMRAQKLYELYRRHASLDEIPALEREKLEQQFFRASLEETWAGTRRFFESRDPRQIERAERDSKHKLALVFRSYLGQSSNWANSGEPSRVIDYQIWCGPAMGAFNEWAKGSFLEQPENRKVDVVALNILYGAAVLERVSQLRNQGVAVQSEWDKLSPQSTEEILGLI